MAKKIRQRDIVTFESLDKNRKQELIDRLFLLNCRIFAGVEKAKFAQYISRKEARWNKVKIYRNLAGEAVGYCGIHLMDIPETENDYSVIRAETGILREYRGSGETLRFCLSEAFKLKLRHPSQPLFLFCTLVHPSSFHLLQRHFFRIFPRPDQETPPQTATMMQWLADYFDEKRIEGASPMVRDTGWITRDSEEEQAFWADCTQPDVRFFLEQNPAYGKGRGLVTLVPLTLPNLLVAAVIYVRKRLQKS